MISWIILVAVLEVMMLLNVNRNQMIAEINQLLVCYNIKTSSTYNSIIYD